MLMKADKSLLVIIDVQTKLAPVIHQSDKLIARMRWLGEIANELDVPVLVTEQYPKGLGISVDDLDGVISNAQVIEKMHFSAVQEPSFMQAIEDIDRPQIILMGMEAHVCILQTALDLLADDYKVFVVEDAVGSRRDSDKQTALKRLRQAGAVIVSTEMAAYEWLFKSGTDQFRHITKNWIRG